MTDNVVLEEIRKINSQITSLKSEIKSEVSGAVEKVTAQVRANSQSIASLQNDIDKKISESVSREMEKYNRTNQGRPPSLTSNTNENYWRARRSVRCWPIRGPNSDLWGLTSEFFAKILGIPPSSLSEDSVESIRRISNPRSNRPTKIQFEVLGTLP